MTPELKLAAGTLKLENTPQAVDPEAAQKLLPLWQLMTQLNSSTTTAPQETAAVVDAIQQAMTPPRVAAIEAMNLTSQDIFASLQQDGFAANNVPGGTTNRPTGSTGTRGSNTSRNQAGGPQVFFGGGGGNFPGGGFQGGGFQNNSGQGTNANGNGTSVQNQQAQGAQVLANRAANLVIAEVIRLLESKIKS